MAGLMGGPPKPKSVPEPIQKDEDGPLAKEALRRRKTQNASGRQSTVLTASAPDGGDYGGGTVG